jgi:hypothetical protein
VFPAFAPVQFHCWEELAAVAVVSYTLSLLQPADWQRWYPRGSFLDIVYPFVHPLSLTVFKSVKDRVKNASQQNEQILIISMALFLIIEKAYQPRDYMSILYCLSGE